MMNFDILKYQTIIVSKNYYYDIEKRRIMFLHLFGKTRYCFYYVKPIQSYAKVTDVWRTRSSYQHLALNAIVQTKIRHETSKWGYSGNSRKSYDESQAVASCVFQAWKRKESDNHRAKCRPRFLVFETRVSLDFSCVQTPPPASQHLDVHFRRSIEESSPTIKHQRSRFKRIQRISFAQSYESQVTSY